MVDHLRTGNRKFVGSTLLGECGVFCTIRIKYNIFHNLKRFYIYQINGLIVAILSHDQMIDILRKGGSVSAVIVPPFQSGKPRKYAPLIFV